MSPSPDSTISLPGIASFQSRPLPPHRHFPSPASPRTLPPVRPSLLTRGLLNHPLDRPKSAIVNRQRSPAASKLRGRPRFYSVSSAAPTLPPIPSASLEGMTEATFDTPSFDSLLSNNLRHDDRNGPSLGLTGTFGLHHSQYDAFGEGPPAYQAQPSGGYYPSSYPTPSHLYNSRPSLPAIDTAQSPYQAYHSQFTSAASSLSAGMYDSQSVQDLEQLATPNPQPFNYSPQQYHPHTQYDMLHPMDPRITGLTLPPNHFDFSVPPSLSSGTISPSSLQPQRPESFLTHLLGDRESRGSISSIDSSRDSTYGDHKPFQHPYFDHHDLAPPIEPKATVPEPNRPQQFALDVPALNVTRQASMDRAVVQGALRDWMMASNRLDLGELKMVIWTPKVAQKSYGNERRYLTPPPMVFMYGIEWFTRSQDTCPISPLLQPRVSIALANRPPERDVETQWHSVEGVNLDMKKNISELKPADRPFWGCALGSQLSANEDDTKTGPKIHVTVTVKGPHKHHAGANGWGPMKGTLEDIRTEDVLGQFPSAPIQIISKASKKKTASKQQESVVTHGSTVSLFNRIKAQSQQTKYLSVTPDPTRVYGTDGKAVSGAVAPVIPPDDNPFRGFSSSPGKMWESFIVWLVDPNRAGGEGHVQNPNPNWPRIPANAIQPGQPIAHPIRYNSIVVLQSVQTGLCSPNLVIRQVEHNEVRGNDGTANDPYACAPEGELLGDLVSHLQKVAFEVYQPDVGDNTVGGLYMASQDAERIAGKFVQSQKQWSLNEQPTQRRSASRDSSVNSTPNQRTILLPMTPHNGPLHLPNSTPTSPISTSSSMDYFAMPSRKPSSQSLFSPTLGSEPTLPSSGDSGPMRRPRPESAGRHNPLQRTSNKKRSDISAHSSTDSLVDYLQTATLQSRPTHSWSLRVEETCIWSIVGTESVSYTFFIPPAYRNSLTQPVAPFPRVDRVIRPGGPIDMGPPGLKRMTQTFTPSTTKPLITLYGQGFEKTVEGAPKHHVFYGDQPASYNEGRCGEVMGASIPETPIHHTVPVTLVSQNGQVIIPTGITYPDFVKNKAATSFHH